MKDFAKKFRKARRKKQSPEHPPAQEEEEDEEEILPRWDLSTLYAGVNAPALLADKRELDQRADAFKKIYEGKVAYLSGAALGAAIREYEEIEALQVKISNYAILLEAEDRDNFPKTAPLKKWCEELKNGLSFFSREIGDMKESNLMTKLVVPELAEYAPWIASQRAKREHALPRKIEETSSKYNSLNLSAWQRLYLETFSDIRAPFKGQQMTLDDIETESVSLENTAAERQEARQAMARALKQQSARIALIYNVRMKDMAIDTSLQKYEHPDQGVHLENGINPEIVDTMFETVKSSFIHLSHKFYSWKAQQQGGDTIASALLFEPPFKGREEDESCYGWDEARKLVTRAFRKFHPRFGRIAQKFFDEKHIDAELRERKESGAFMMPIGPDHLPFILLSFGNGMNDVVSSLGHELGHGIHQVLAEKAQGTLLSDMSTVVSETASIFAEMLVFEEIFQSEKNPEVRRSLLAARIENMLDNGLMQLSFYDFERRVHAERKKGELDAEQISDIWIETQKEYYGPAVELDEYDRYYWMNVSHFFETPFYVYSYSFAQMAVSALFQEYKKSEKEGPQALAAFKENYVGLLETGITRSSYEMFEPFGLNPEQPAFWESGLMLIRQYLDDLTRPDAPEPAAKKSPSAPKPPTPGL